MKIQQARFLIISIVTDINKFFSILKIWNKNVKFNAISKYKKTLKEWGKNSGVYYTFQFFRFVTWNSRFDFWGVQKIKMRLTAKTIFIRNLRIGKKSCHLQTFLLGSTYYTALKITKLITLKQLGIFKITLIKLASLANILEMRCKTICWS